MTTNSGAWYWCGSCWRWHSWSQTNPVHFSLAPIEAQTPSATNFDGTPEEMRRFEAYRALRRADAAIIAMELRIDAEIGEHDTTPEPEALREAYERGVVDGRRVEIEAATGQPWDPDIAADE